MVSDLSSCLPYPWLHHHRRKYHSQASKLANGNERKLTTDTKGITVEKITNPVTRDETIKRCGITSQVETIEDFKTRKPIPQRITTTLPSGLTSVMQLSKSYAEGGADLSKLTSTVGLNGNL